MTRTSHRRSGRPTMLRAVVAALCLVGLLTACELRLETPAPTAPVPGADEVARQAAATDAVAIAELAGRAGGAAGTAGADALVVEVLAEVAATSQAHATALGGVYRPWPQEPSASPSPATQTPTPEPDPTPQDVVAALQDAAGRAGDDADTVTDGPLARLLASVAASRSVLASELEADLAGTALTLPTSAPTAEAATAQAAEPDGVIGRVPGVQDSSLTALLKAEDMLGAAWEVLAARSDDDARASAALLASQHRARAQAWAQALGVDATALDPRRDAYALPAEVLDPEGEPSTALVALESELGERLAALVAQAGPGSRGAFVSALRENTLLVRQAGGTGSELPGIGDDAGATSAGQTG